MLAPVLALMLAAATLAAAAAPPVSADLDGDGTAERIEQRAVRCLTDGRRHAPPCATDDVRYELPELVDPCAGGDRTTRLLRGSHEAFVDVTLVDADGDGTRDEALVEGYGGASARNGEARIVRFVPGADGCATVKVLMSIPSPRFRTHRPSGAAYATTGFLKVSGREVRLQQAWYRKDDGGCCPTWAATATFRYRASSDSYRKVRETVKRLPGPRAMTA
jgi:hypothetical protein